MRGQSPQIVAAGNADRVPEVAADLTEASFWNASQYRTAGSRILARFSIKDEFVAALVNQANGRRVAEPTDLETRIDPLAEASALALGHIKQGLEDGATVVAGGEQLHRDSGGWFVAPAVIGNVSPAMAVAREEIFGPSSRCRRSTPTRKHSAWPTTPIAGRRHVWSHDIDRALTPARGLAAGTVAVNGPDAEHASLLPRPDRDSDVEGS
ncbi:aldehyde dehydrogenase family protein [Streptomyces phaeochromogenes]